MLAEGAARIPPRVDRMPERFDEEPGALFLTIRFTPDMFANLGILGNAFPI